MASSGFILVLFILLVIIACSCGIFGSSAPACGGYRDKKES
ncbi:sporulation protein YjcZ [Paenibacillus glycanilyticus]